MDSETQEMCAIASSNARSLEEILLTVDDVFSLSEYDIIDVKSRCAQIIECMDLINQ